MISIRQPIIYKSMVGVGCKQPKQIVPVRILPNNLKPTLKPNHVSPDMLDTLNTSVYFVGKGIFLFTIFYCSMNWVYYRGMRKDLEKYAEQKKEDDKRRKLEREKLFPKIQKNSQSSQSNQDQDNKE